MGGDALSRPVQGWFPPLLGESLADPTTLPFWEAAGDDRLVVARCTGCGTCRLPPTPLCWVCRSRQVIWKLPGTGTVYTFTVVRHALHPDLVPISPYVTGLVELDGTQGAGARMLANIVDCVPDEVFIGMELEVIFEHITDTMHVVRFRPARHAEESSR